MDRYKMAVVKIDSHGPNSLLVGKSVYGFARDHFMKNDISLILKIKRPFPERVSRYKGVQMVPSTDHLTFPKLGYCGVFHVEEFLGECMSRPKFRATQNLARDPRSKV